MAPRPRSRRMQRTVLAALVTASVSIPVVGATGPASVPAPPPAVTGPVSTAAPDALRERYAANRRGIEAARRMAADHGDTERAAALRAVAGPARRRFLFFDGRDGGRVVEVLGDLAHAAHIAVLVPGSDTGLGTYGRFRADAVALRRQLGGRAAVIAWLGYRTPGTVSLAVLTPARADAAAPRLHRFVEGVAAARPAARITLLCHSYGSVVCARASPGLRVSDIVLYGSPGTGADGVEALHTGATVWVGRGVGDRVARVPHVRLQLLFATVGFGTDPMAESFGARIFDTGPGGHSDYLDPGSVSLRNIARIVSGDVPQEGEEDRRA